MRFIADNLVVRGLLFIIALIVVLIPFHATVTVWFASNFGHYTAIRLWKEVLLVGLVSGVGLLLLRDKGLCQRIWQQPLIRTIFLLIGLYVALHGIIGSISLLRDEVALRALGYGLVSNLRFLLFFVSCVVVGSYVAPWLQANWRRLLLWPAVVVIGFGLLQALVLPVDFLKHVGYGPETIAPYIAVDQKDDYARIQSTLRGPNPLGAYLVIVITAVVGLFAAARLSLWQFAVAIVATTVVLYGTYSRSAWIGVLCSLTMLAWFLLRSAKLRKYIAISMVALVLVGAGTIFVLRDNDYVQNVVFHTDEHSESAASSNEARTSALRSGVHDVVSEPLGRGPGTAGPASVYNNGNARIAENYFLQIGQEVGAVGLTVFIVICYMVGRVLWRIHQRTEVATILLASLIGITIINMISHAWTDDTLAYVWWGFAGLVIGAYGLQKDKSRAKKAI